MSVFYDHLIGLDELHNELMDFNLPSKEHYHVLEICDSTLHHEILNVILYELPLEHHEKFLVAFHTKPDDAGHLPYLKQFSPYVEESIKNAAAKAKQKLIEEMKKHK